MKKAALITTALIALCFAQDANARERQVYSQYPEPNFYDGDTGQGYTAPQYHAPQAGDGRIYPGREVYGREFGPLPRHPGDYRDAVDRGTWQPDPDGGSKGFYGW